LQRGFTFYSKDVIQRGSRGEDDDIFKMIDESRAERGGGAEQAVRECVETRVAMEV